MPKPRLRCLGDAVLEDAEGNVIASGERLAKPLAVLIYLAMSSRPIFRAELADLIWDKSDPSQRLAALRQAVKELRDSLGRETLTGRSRLELRRDGIECDVLSLRLAIREKRWAEARDIARDGGRFLDGLPLAPTAEWEHWVDGQAETLRREINSIPSDDGTEAGANETATVHPTPGEPAPTVPANSAARRRPGRPLRAAYGFVVLAVAAGVVAIPRPRVEPPPPLTALPGSGALPLTERHTHFSDTIPLANPGPAGIMGIGIRGAYCRNEVFPRYRVVTVDSRVRWTTMGFDIHAGCDEIEIEATGLVAFSTDPGNSASPDGRPDIRDPAPFAPLPDAPVQSLICRVGGTEPFLVGRRTRLEMRVSGGLECGINESSTVNDVYLDNSGSWTVRVIVHYNAIAVRMRTLTSSAAPADGGTRTATPPIHAQSTPR